MPTVEIQVKSKGIWTDYQGAYDALKRHSFGEYSMLEMDTEVIPSLPHRKVGDREEYFVPFLRTQE